MAKLTRIQQLTFAGILKPPPAPQPAPAVIDAIDSLTDDEFNAILSVRAKIAPANQPAYDATILSAGF